MSFLDTNASQFYQDEYIAQGCLTNSKHPDRFVRGVYPTHVLSGSGSTLKCTNGKAYIDYICGLGTNLIGYDNMKYITEITGAIQKGVSHSLPTLYELMLASKIKEICPIAERVKFVMTGSEGCSTSVRIARSFTGRNLIMSEGYHGWHDDFVSLTPPAHGIPERTTIAALDIDRIDKSTVAGVIIEPIITDLSEKRIEFLKRLREKCDQSGTVLIFDETITALRFPKFFAYKYLNIKPDILIFGKALGNGIPISCICGKKELMNGDYFVSSTYAGNILSMQAGISVISLLKEDKRFDIEKLWEEGQKFINRFNEICLPHVWIEGYPTRGVIKSVGDMTKAVFMQEMAKAGILFGPSWFYNFHLINSNDLVYTTLNNFMIRFKTHKMELAGNMPTGAFASRVRGNG